MISGDRKRDKESMSQRTITDSGITVVMRQAAKTERLEKRETEKREKETESDRK